MIEVKKLDSNKSHLLKLSKKFMKYIAFEIVKNEIHKFPSFSTFNAY